MKRISVQFKDDFYEDVQELSKRMNAPIAGLIRYALDKTFYDELDEIFCTRAVMKLSDIDRSRLPNWREYRRQHDERQATVDKFKERYEHRRHDPVAASRGLS